MSGSLVFGWDRKFHPFVEVEGKNQIFDRRHTLSVIRQLSSKSSNVIIQRKVSIKPIKMVASSMNLLLPLKNCIDCRYLILIRRYKRSQFESTLVSILWDAKKDLVYDVKILIGKFLGNGLN